MVVPLCPVSFWHAAAGKVRRFYSFRRRETFMSGSVLALYLILIVVLVFWLCSDDRR